MSRRRIAVIGSIVVGVGGGIAVWVWPLLVRAAATTLLTGEWGGVADVGTASWSLGRTLELTDVGDEVAGLRVARTELTFTQHPLTGDPGPLAHARFVNGEPWDHGDRFATIDQIDYVRGAERGKRVTIRGLDGEVGPDRLQAWIDAVTRIVEAPGVVGDGSGEPLDGIRVERSRLRLLLSGGEHPVSLPFEDLNAELTLVGPKALVAHKLRADVAGGRLAASGDVDWTVGTLTWHAQVHALALDLATVAAQFPFLPDGATGHLTAFADLRAAADFVVGAGWVEGRQLAVWEQPVADRVLDELGVRAAREDTLDVRATLRADRGRVFFADLIALGEPVNLFGNGSVGLDGRDLDVGLVPRFLEQRTLREIPLRDGGAGDLLLDVVKGTLVQLRITGSFSAPTVVAQPLPLVTEPLRRFLDLLR